MVARARDQAKANDDGGWSRLDGGSRALRRIRRGEFGNGDDADGRGDAAASRHSDYHHKYHSDAERGDACSNRSASSKEQRAAT